MRSYFVLLDARETQGRRAPVVHKGMGNASPRWGFAALIGALVAVVALVAACGSSGRSAYDDGTTPGASSGGDVGGPALVPKGALAIEPVDTEVAVEDGKPLPTVDYHAFLVHDDGSREDVTANAVFRVVQNAGPVQATFAGPKLTASPNAVGKARVHADLKTLSGEATLRIRLKKAIVAGGAPSDAATKFGGVVDPARKPAIVYPSDGVMVPPNMNEIEWHFQPGAGNDLFDLVVKGTLLDLDVYFACNAVGGGCAYAPDATVWGILASAGRGDDALATTLRGTSKAGGASVGASASQTIAFGEEDILGGIYYWNAGAGATMRYEFGVSGQKAETFMNAPKAGAAQCVGCHVLSRDGERVSLGLDIPGPAAYKVFDVASKSMIFAQGGAAGGSGANFFSFSPDKKQIMVSNGVTLSLRDATTGAAVQDMAGEGAMPDWSPDGNSIVYAKSNQSPPCFAGLCAATGVSEASLFVLKNAGGTWGNPVGLVAAGGQNAFYPSYSPDGAWVGFNRGSVGMNAKGETKSSYDAPDAALWAVAAAGGSPVALARAGSTHGDSWPKWMVQTQNYRGKKLMWLTFSSRRAYGLRLAADQNAQIWMAAFDPDAAAQGKDPSFAAFWLPFQEISSGNHIAQWVTKVVRQGCGDRSQCEASEDCIDTVCRPAIK